MTTIVSIRATHGAGKSEIVRKILAKYPHSAKFEEGAKRPFGYVVELPASRKLFVVGPYLTACGGCDAVQPYARIWPLVDAYAQAGYDVLLEGALVSSSYGSIGHSMNYWATNQGARCYFAFLDTPLATCLQRIAQRRAARGNLEPVNPHNTSVKFANVARTKDQMRKLGSSISIVDIDHTAPVKGVLKLFGVRLNKEPA